jgi:MFS family permease
MIAKQVSWRTPVVILACGCVISALGFGPRSAFGFFLSPMSNANGWGRDVFALALAIQMLLWGAAQPLAGAIADRFGAARVPSPIVSGCLRWRTPPLQVRSISPPAC